MKPFSCSAVLLGAVALAAAVAAEDAAAAAAAALSCRAVSGAAAPTVVELYTSEGCSSCPPADQWLSTLNGRSDVLPLAFHVNYWDRLGWTDRFATPASTERQYAVVRQTGGTSAYTPQVVVDGRDWRDWPRLPKTAAAAAAVTVTLTRDGDTVSATVAAAKGGPAQLDGYWAVLEDGHQSKVRSGENAGATLHHDHVVRLFQPVPAWPAGAGNHASLTVSGGVAANPRRVVFVVTDAASHRPLQALALGC